MYMSPIYFDIKLTQYTYSLKNMTEDDNKSTISSSYDELQQNIIKDYIIHKGLHVNTYLSVTEAKALFQDDKFNLTKLKKLFDEDQSKEIVSKLSNGTRYYYPVCHKSKVKHLFEESDGEDIEEKNSFSFYNHEIHLTYKTHIDPEELLTHFTKLPGFSVLRYSIVNESSDTINSYDHTHAYFLFLNHVRVTDPRFFDYKGIHPHIKKPRTAYHRTSSRVTKGTGADICCRYHLKQPNARRITNYPIATEPQFKKTKNGVVLTGYLANSETLSEYSTPQDMELIYYQEPTPDRNALTKAFARYTVRHSKDSIKCESQPDPLPWQKQLRFILNTKAEDRNIFWISDDKGGVGKSTFCKFIKNKIVLRSGRSTDLKTALANELKTVKNPDVIFFDLARSVSSSESKDHFILRHDNDPPERFDLDSKYKNKDLMSLIEEIKDCMFVLSKYESRVIKLDKPPHIVIFSNYRPDVQTLSLDRWIITSISFDYNFDVILCKGANTKKQLDYCNNIISTIGKGNRLCVQMKKTEQDLETSLLFLSAKVKINFWRKGLIPVEIINTVKKLEHVPSQSQSPLHEKREQEIIYHTIETRKMTKEEILNFQKYYPEEANVEPESDPPPCGKFEDIDIDTLEFYYQQIYLHRGIIEDVSSCPTYKNYCELRNTTLVEDIPRDK